MTQTNTPKAAPQYGMWTRVNRYGESDPEAVKLVEERAGGWFVVMTQDGKNHRIKWHNMATIAYARRWNPALAARIEAWAREEGVTL